MQIPLLGWRLWFFNGKVLSGMRHQVWEVPTLEAACSRDCGDVPSRTCRCGIYAYVDGHDMEGECRHAFWIAKVASTIGFPLWAVGLLGAIAVSVASARPASSGSAPLLVTLLILAVVGSTMLSFSKRCRQDWSSALIGVVVITGRVLLYSDGMRAERARLVALWNVLDLPADQVGKIEARYQVPVFNRGELERLRAYASEWGSFTLEGAAS